MLARDALVTLPPFYFSIDIPRGLFQIFQWIAFLSGTPEILDRVPDAKIEMLGDLDGLDSTGVRHIMWRVIDHVSAVMKYLL